MRSVILALGLLLSLSVFAASPHLVRGAEVTEIAYVSGGSLFIRPVGTGTPRRIPLPGKIEGAAWSSDGQNLAAADNAGRVKLVSLPALKVSSLASSRWTGSSPYAQPIWSPDGRYLAYLSGGGPNVATLSVWDTTSARSRVLVGRVSQVLESLAWSHDSTRIVVAIGSVNTLAPKIRNPLLEVVRVSNGAVTRIGYESDAAWSPDDRFLSFDRFKTCGASSCTVDQYVGPAVGGSPILLLRDNTTDFVGDSWARRGQGYAFDRWLLNSSGHPTRRIATVPQIVRAWTTDGSRAAVVTVHPYVSARPRLSIVTATGTRTAIHTSARTDSCGACSKVFYDLCWNRAGNALAFISPNIYTPRQKIVVGGVYLRTVGTQGLTSIPVPGRDRYLVGFANRDSDLIVGSGKALYQYTPTSHALHTLATDVTPGTAVIPGV